MSTQPETSAPQTGMANMLNVKWGWIMALGVVMVILGSLAIIFPAATSVSLSLLVGILFVIGGVSHLVGMFRAAGAGEFFLRLLVAVIYLAAGIMMLVYPLDSTVTLTAILALFFIAQGLANIIMSIINRKTPAWGWLMVNGLVSLILGGMIWAELPSSAGWAIGLLVGIWLIFDGWALIMASWIMRKEEDMGRLATA